MMYEFLGKKDKEAFETYRRYCKIERWKNVYILGDLNARTKTLWENIVQDKTDETLGVLTQTESLHPSTIFQINS